MATDGTDAVFDVLEAYENQLMFSNGSQIQIYESLAEIAQSPSIKKFQYAALVRQERLLLIWHDDLSAILSQAMEIESRILGLVWGSAKNPFGGFDSGLQSHAPSAYAGSTLNLTPEKEKDASVAVEEMDGEMDVEDFGPKESLARPLIFTSAIYVGLGVLLIWILVVGFGNRALQIQIMTDHFYPRLALILSEPVFLCLGLFFVIVIFNNCFQLIGPIGSIKTNSRFYSAIKPNLAQARALGFTPPRLPSKCLSIPNHSRVLSSRQLPPYKQPSPTTNRAGAQLAFS